MEKNFVKRILNNKEKSSHARSHKVLTFPCFTEAWGNIHPEFHTLYISRAIILPPTV